LVAHTELRVLCVRCEDRMLRPLVIFPPLYRVEPESRLGFSRTASSNLPGAGACLCAQVNGFLQNVGKAKACNIKVGFSGADTYYSIWPEWVSNATWQNDYAIGQVRKTAKPFFECRVDSFLP
jgi:hypothetical protein